MIRALSIRQPWAWLIVHGEKPVENRSWSTNVRGRILIHASRRYDVLADVAVPIDEPLDFGGIVGEAEIVDCVQEHESEWFTGPYGLVLKNAKTLPFRAVRGRQGFFYVEDK